MLGHIVNTEWVVVETTVENECAEVECLVMRVCRCLHNKNVQTRCCSRAAGNQCQLRLISVHDKATTSSSHEQSTKVVRIPDTHHQHSKASQAPEVSQKTQFTLTSAFFSSTIICPQSVLSKNTAIFSPAPFRCLFLQTLLLSLHQS